MITPNKGATNADSFFYEIPSSATALKISEYKGEFSYLSSLAVIIEDLKGTQYEHRLPMVKNRAFVVSYRRALEIDLKAAISNHKSIGRIFIKGEGYYETQNKKICPPVIPLDFRYF